MVKLGSTIKYVREAKGLTQRAAARLLGISPEYLCNLEHDNATPSMKVLDTMSSAWGVEIYVLAWCRTSESRLLPKPVRWPRRQLQLILEEIIDK